MDSSSSLLSDSFSLSTQCLSEKKAESCPMVVQTKLKSKKSKKRNMLERKVIESQDIPSAGSAFLPEQKSLEQSDFIPTMWFLDYSGSMNTTEKKAALTQTLNTIVQQYEEKQSSQWLSITKISDRPDFFLPLGFHNKEAILSLMDHKPEGGTFLWECVASCLKRCVEVNLSSANVVILTDGYDNKSRGNWKGIEGAVKLMNLARELGISVTISFIQLGGLNSEQQNIKAAAHITGGCYLHIHLNQVNAEDLKKALSQISTFGLTVHQTLATADTREPFIQSQRLAGYQEIPKWTQVSDLIKNSPEYTAMVISGLYAKCQPMEKVIVKCLLQQFWDLVEQEKSFVIKARELRDNCYLKLPEDGKKQYTKASMSNFYNSKILPCISSLVKRNSANCGLLELDSDSEQKLSLCDKMMSDLSLSESHKELRLTV